MELFEKQQNPFSDKIELVENMLKTQATTKDGEFFETPLGKYQLMTQFQAEGELEEYWNERVWEALAPIKDSWLIINGLINIYDIKSRLIEESGYGVLSIDGEAYEDEIGANDYVLIKIEGANELFR